MKRHEDRPGLEIADTGKIEMSFEISRKSAVIRNITKGPFEHTFAAAEYATRRGFHFLYSCNLGQTPTRLVPTLAVQSV